MKKIKPTSKRIFFDISAVAILFFVSLVFTVPSFASAILGVLVIWGPLSLVYYFIMVVIPYIEIVPTSHDLVYRSDYGLKRIIPVASISKIEMGSGPGGYEHALFVRYDKAGSERTLKIKSSYLHHQDVALLLKTLKEVNEKIKINKEFEDYLSTPKWWHR